VTEQPRVAILAHGLFTRQTAKTAIGALRYAPYPIVAVVDATHAGQDAGSVVGAGHGVPVVATVGEAIRSGADTLLIGTAAPGGRIPDDYRPFLADALARGLAVWNGLHERVLADPALRAAADRGGGRVRELREPPAGLPVGGHRSRRVGAFVALTVGSDAAVGKMTVALELVRALERAEARATFVATGQTGIAIAGEGISVDAVVADFIAGAAEQLVCAAAERADWVVVEGQGALTHPGFSGVTLGLLHGSAPDLLILCHDATRAEVKGFPGLPLRSLPELVALYETAAAWSRTPGAHVPVVGVALNTSALDPAEAARAVRVAADETGLPAADPVRDGAAGADRLAAAMLAARGS
jgi:uncharacterized NAD-dependent epimerase/dehydratase family protein